MSAASLLTSICTPGQPKSADYRPVRHLAGSFSAVSLQRGIRCARQSREQVFAVLLFARAALSQSPGTPPAGSCVTTCTNRALAVEARSLRSASGASLQHTHEPYNRSQISRALTVPLCREAAKLVLNTWSTALVIGFGGNTRQEPQRDSAL